MISSSKFKSDYTISLPDRSIEDVNQLRKLLLGDIAHLKRKAARYSQGDETGETKITRKIALLEDILDQLWDQLCVARADRREANEAKA